MSSPDFNVHYIFVKYKSKLFVCMSYLNKITTSTGETCNGGFLILLLINIKTFGQKFSLKNIKRKLK